MDVIEFLLWLSETPIMKIARMVGYVSFAAGLWYLAIAGFNSRENYYFVRMGRWMMLSGAIHHTVVAIWAGLAAVQIQIQPAEFTALLTITTFMMLFGFISFAIGVSR